MYAPRVTESLDLAALVLWYVALLFSLTFHEAAHAWAARRGGDPTAYLGGQVTLDPRPHIRREPFGTVFVPLLAFAMAGWMIGWASTPFDPHWAARHPRRAAWMALAGPAANALLVVAAGLAIRAGVAGGAFAPTPGLGLDALVVSPEGGVAQTFAALLSVLFSLNLLLLVFNLIPVPPLDGASAIGLLLPERLALRLQVAFRRPFWGFAGILAAWLLIREVFGPVYRIAVAMLFGGA